MNLISAKFINKTREFTVVGLLVLRGRREEESWPVTGESRFGIEVVFYFS